MKKKKGEKYIYILDNGEEIYLPQGPPGGGRWFVPVLMLLALLWLLIEMINL